MIKSCEEPIFSLELNYRSYIYTHTDIYTYTYIYTCIYRQCVLEYKISIKEQEQKYSFDKIAEAKFF